LANLTWILNDDGDMICRLLSNKSSKKRSFPNPTLMRNGIPIEIAETWASSGDFDE
jgi:hypothetical protein